MTNNKLFTECQRFNQWWVWGILLLVEGLMIYGVIQQIVMKIPFGTNTSSDFGLILGTVSITLTVVIFRLIQLNTSIDESGIAVRFFPFIKLRNYDWKDIESIEVRHYQPILEFGGWGIRGFRNNRALNISGTYGLQIYFKNGKKLLIGTQKAEELSLLIEKLNERLN